MRVGRSADPEIEAVAAVVHRLSVLLSAGVAPASALRHVADADVETVAEGAEAARAARRRRRMRAVAEAASRGEDVVATLLAGVPGDRRRSTPDRGPAVLRRAVRRRRGAAPPGEEDASWATLAASWRVAERTGAPISSTLVGLAESMRELGRARRDIAVALAGPAAAARVVGLLPAVAVGFGMLLGLDVLRVLLGTVPGLACLVSGLGLTALARVWTRRLIRRSTPTDPTPGLALDLLAVALSGGVSADRAVAVVDGALEECGLPGSGGRATGVLALSTRAGVPAVTLLRSEARLARRRAQGEGRQAAAALGVTLMLPLGVCVLPAFMLLGVAPMVMSVLLSTLGAAGGGAG